MAGAVPAETAVALQGALAAENAAIYGYGVAGARLSGAQLAAAQQDWNQHRAAQATLTAMLTRLGAQPVPAAAAYTLPFPVRTAQQAASLAAFLEEGVTRAYLGLVALDDASLRAFGARAMQACALRAASWRGSTVAFPGLPASALRRPRRSNRSR
jgi:hypothetical protein